MRRGALILVALIALLLGGSTPAPAQLPAPAGTASATSGGAESELSPLTRLTAWIATQQRTMHRELVRGLRTLSQTHALQAVWALVLGSFLYGVFHAVGPGHGKAIIATYLATQPYRMGRGLWLSAAGAYAQGVTAVALVYGLVVVAGWLPRDTQAAVDWSERASFALVVLIGASLAWRAARGLLGQGGHEHGHGRAAAQPPGHDHEHAHEHEHDHVHGHGAGHCHPRGPEDGHHGHHHHDDGAHGHGSPGPRRHGEAPEHAAAHAQHHDHHVHDAHCGHVHAPTNEMIEKAVDWRATLGIVATIGMRPCSGAILVLVLATTLDLNWAGVAAVVAMSTGTALALGAIGIVVIQARSWAVAMLGGSGTGRVQIVANGVALVGGCIVALLGASLLAGSFGPAHPLGL